MMMLVTSPPILTQYPSLSWNAGAGVEAAFTDTARRALARKERLAAKAAAELGAPPGVPSAPRRVITVLG